MPSSTFTSGTAHGCLPHIVLCLPLPPRPVHAHPRDPSFLLSPTHNACTDHRCRKPKGIDYARGLLRTTGADCEESVKADLAALFQRAGVDPSFSFQDREFFGGRAAFLRAMMRKTAGLREQTGQAARPAAAPRSSAPPEPPMSEEQINILSRDSEVWGRMERQQGGTHPVHMPWIAGARDACDALLKVFSAHLIGWDLLAHVERPLAHSRWAA